MPQQNAVSSIARRSWEALRRSTLLLHRPVSTTSTSIAHQFDPNKNCRPPLLPSPIDLTFRANPLFMERFLTSSSSTLSSRTKNSDPSNLTSNIGQDPTSPSPASSSAEPSGKSPFFVNRPPTYVEEAVNGGNSKGIFAKLWDRYSLEGQKKRIILGERLFRSAQFRANDL